MPYVYAMAADTLRRKLVESNAWTPFDWDGCAELVADLQGSMRNVYVLAYRHITPFDRLPYLMSRLRHPGVRDRVLEQYSEVPDHLHDPLTRRALALGSTLRRAIEAMQPDGTGMESELNNFVSNLEEVPLDDSVAESPHSLVKRVQLHARSSTWGWAAASVRLRQNIKHCEKFAFAGVQQAWDSCSSVLRRLVHAGLEHASGCRGGRWRTGSMV